MAMSRTVVALLASGLLALAPIPAGAQSPPAPTPPPQPPTLQKVRDTGVITLAHRESSSPFSFFDQNKRPVGYALDLCMKVVEGLRRELKLPGLRVEYLAVSAAQRIPSIVDGKADLECGNTTNTAARRKQVAFTVTHYFAGGRLLVRSDAKIKRLSDIGSRTVVVNAGSTHAQYLDTALAKGLFKGRKLEVKDSDAAFAELDAGRAAAYLHDDIVLFALRANTKEPQQWDVVGEFTTVEPLAIMLRRNDPDFKKFVDLVLSRAMVDGEVNTAYRRWFLNPIPPRGITLGIPVSPLLREQFTFPTDKVGDEVGG